MIAMPAWIRRLRMICRWTRPMRSWMESLGRAPSAPPLRPSLMPDRVSCRELLEQAGLQLGHADAARARLEHAADLGASHVDATARADALELSDACPAGKRAAADGDVRRREDGGGLCERDPVRRDARHAQVPVDADEPVTEELGAGSALP